MKSMPTPTEQNSHTGQGAGRLTQPVRLAVIDMSSFIECLPADVRKKLSLYDIKRVCDNYRKRPCGECHLKPGETCDICGAVEKPNAPKVCDTKNQKPKPMDTPQTETPENRTGCGSPDAACSAADIQCCRCKNKHSMADRVEKRTGPGSYSSRCPRCNGESFFRINQPPNDKLIHPDKAL